MKMICLLFFGTLMSCQVPHNGAWRTIPRTDLPSYLVSVEKNEEGWSVEGKKCRDLAEMESLLVKSKGQPALISISKLGFVSGAELDAVVASLNRSSARRVFCDQARGSINSITSVLEFVP